MKNQEAKEIVRRLKSIYPMSSSLNFDEFAKEYMDVLLKLDSNKALATVEKVRMQCKFMPSIAEFVELYNKNGQAPTYTNKEYCYICANTGFVFYSRKSDKDEVSYDFPAYCNCEKGKQWSIETGEYRTISINTIYTPDMLNKLADINKEKFPEAEKNINALRGKLEYKIQLHA